MANMFEALLADDDIRDPAAIAAALRRQQKLGTLGQLMGVQPTREVGGQMIEGAQTSLRSAMAKQQAAKEAASRRAEREQAQANWQAQMERDQARDAEQRRQFAVQEARLGRSQDAEAKRQWSHAVDPITGTMRLYNQITGEWKDPEGLGGTQLAGAPAGPSVVGFPNQPAGLKLTETQEKSRGFASRMAQNYPALEQMLESGYRPGVKDVSVFMRAAESPVASPLLEKAISPEGRQFMNAASHLVTAVLRKESGAAITEAEWARAFRDWLPRPGDSDEEIQRKLGNLRAEMESMAAGAGPAGRYWGGPAIPQAQGVSPQERVNASPQGPRPGDKYLSGGQ